MPTLNLAGITFSGDANGSGGFHFDGLDDWFSLSDSKSPVNERPQAHGAFGIGFDYRESLVLSMKVWYKATSRLELIQAKRHLLGALGAAGRKTAALTDADGTTSRIVSVRAAPSPDSRGSMAFTYVIDMVATDPLAYGEEISVSTGVPVSTGGLAFPLGTGPSGNYIDFGGAGSSGRVALTNTGTAPVFPKLEVTGGLELGFVATDVTIGKILRFERFIPVGSTIAINQRTGTASIDGQSDVSGFLTSRDFFQIGAGETHQIQFAPLGAVTGIPILTARLAPGSY